MLSNWARKYSQVILLPMVKFMGGLGISPGMVTVIGFGLMLVVAYVLSLGQFQVGAWLLLLAGSFDALDGALARGTNRTTRFGAFLDSTLDRVAEAAIFLGLLWHYLTQADHQLVVLIYMSVIGSLLVSYTRARAEGLGVELKEGLLTRLERMVLIGVGLLFGWMVPVLWFLAIFTNLTATQRAWVVWRKLNYGRE